MRVLTFILIQYTITSKEFNMAKKPLGYKPMNKAAQVLGAKGGKVGGPARAKALSSTERSAIARKGAIAKNAKGKS
jgi:hypothetical protein